MWAASTSAYDGSLPLPLSLDRLDFSGAPLRAEPKEIHFEAPIGQPRSWVVPRKLTSIINIIRQRLPAVSGKGWNLKLANLDWSHGSAPSWLPDLGQVSWPLWSSVSLTLQCEALIPSTTYPSLEYESATMSSIQSQVPQQPGGRVLGVPSPPVQWFHYLDLHWINCTNCPRGRGTREVPRSQAQWFLSLFNRIFHFRLISSLQTSCKDNFHLPFTHLPPILTPYLSMVPSSKLRD